MGDGVLCEFASVVDAVACAVAIQRGMAEREAAVPEAERIRFRIGINLGDVIVEDDDIYGDGVNVAARLEGLAEPGGVCVAGKVHEQVKDKLALALRADGPAAGQEHRRAGRGLARGAWRGRRAPRREALAAPGGAGAAVALLLLLVVLAGVGGWWWYEGRSRPWAAGPPLPDRPSIAVLPFDDLGGDERQERLADGFTEDLITELARFARPARHRPQLELHLQGQAGRRAPGRPGARRALRARGQPPDRPPSGCGSRRS